LKKSFPVFVLLLFFIFSFKDNSKSVEAKLPSQVNSELILKYAKGFSLINNTNYKVLEITKPWPEAIKSYKYLIASNEQL